MTDALPTLYFKRGCSGCDVARKWLAQHGIRVKEREMFKQPLSVREIEDVLGDRPVTVALSTRTKQFAARGLNQREHSEAELLRHMEAEPRLIRRPLIQVGDRLLVGFNEAEWAETLLVNR
jgi:Spx/MgsR family transcriptional regulator